MQNRQIIRYDCRLREGTFGCWDVYRVYSDGSEDIDPDLKGVTGYAGKRVAAKWTKRLKRERRA